MVCNKDTQWNGTDLCPHCACCIACSILFSILFNILIWIFICQFHQLNDSCPLFPYNHTSQLYDSRVRDLRRSDCLLSSLFLMTVPLEKATVPISKYSRVPPHHRGGTHLGKVCPLGFVPSTGQATQANAAFSGTWPEAVGQIPDKPALTWVYRANLNSYNMSCRRDNSFEGCRKMYGRFSAVQFFQC